tara:strand:- start:205 stop:456 length:252 start_codon:yes stop_codon:yes gene_type:complete
MSNITTTKEFAISKEVLIEEENGTHDITYELNSNNCMYSHDDGVTYIQHGTNTDDTSDTKVEITVVEDTGWVYIMLYALENRG